MYLPGRGDVPTPSYVLTYVTDRVPPSLCLARERERGVQYSAQEKQKTEVLGSSIFTDDDVCTMFGMFDPTGKGKISRDQCKQGGWRGEYSFPIWFSIRGAETRARSRGVMAGMWVGCCDFSPARRGSVLSGETFFFCILSVDSRFDFQLLFGV